MFERGKEYQGACARLHPLVVVIYYLCVLLLVMFSNSLLMLALAIAFGLLYAGAAAGKKNLRAILILTCLMVAIMTILNALFTHNGATVLFYIGANRITLEAALFGTMAGLMVGAIVIWLASFRALMTGDKLIFIFGRIAPVLGLVIAMIFRLIPLLRERYAEIDAGQKALGHGAERGIGKRMKLQATELSVLVAWSLESSIESADSMTARGYGLRGRSSYHLFHFRSTDAVALLFIALFALPAVIGYAHGAFRLSYYPTITRFVPELSPWILYLTLLSYLALLLFPLIAHLLGELRWKRYESRI